jgi:lambda family phage tail tape measure protein
MAMNLDALLRIKADVQGENNIRRLGNSLQGLQGRAKNAALGFNSLKGAVGGFAAAIAGSAIVGGLGAMVKSAVNLGDELGKMSARTGVAQGALIGLRNAAALSDVENEKLQAGLTRLNVAMVAAADGNAAAEAKFKRLGISVKNAAGEVRPTDQVFKDLGDRFKDMPNGAEKAAAAVSIFGKAGADLIPLLNGGREAMEAFNFELSDEFAARSELFNDTLTILGFKTEGFKLQLADALLPALQSILEVFGDLFNTDQDWTALFKVIEGVIRGIAVAIYTVVKAVDILIKNIVAAAQAATQAFAGDFAGAFKTITTRVSSGFAEAKQSIADLNKLAFGSAAAPGTGRRTGGRNMALDTSAADKAAAAAAKKAASEQERLLKERAALMKRGMDLQEQLRRSVQDVTLSSQVVTASPVKQLELTGQKAIIESARQVEDLRKNVRELMADFEKAGGSLDATPFFDLINQLSNANVALVNKTYQQDFAELYASQGEAIDKATESVYENARALQYNNDIMGGLKDGLSGYIEQIGTMRDALSNLSQQAFKGIEDALVSLATTGTANFRDFAISILEATSRMIIQQLVLKSIMQAIGAIGGGGGGLLAGGGGGFTQFNASGVGFNPAAFSGVSFANGGIMTGDGPLPLNKYASGGIASSPQLAMFGEGRRPEAYVPLPDGRRIPVAMQGGGGTAVTVNVDASGSSVQGDGPNANQLGRVLGAAMQAEIIKQQRPGGLLATTR